MVWGWENYRQAWTAGILPQDSVVRPVILGPLYLNLVVFLPLPVKTSLIVFQESTVPAEPDLAS